MGEQQAGIKLADARLEIGWMRWGVPITGDNPFRPNISPSTPLQCTNGTQYGGIGMYTWHVPENMAPGVYWIAARLLAGPGQPFSTSPKPNVIQPVEASGPPSCAFTVGSRDVPTEPREPSGG